MVKIDLITGFLGSGKTTFIKKYAKFLIDKGLNICILENDFGAVNVDMMVLQDIMGEHCELEMVSGGCDKDCHRRRFKTKLIAMGMCGYDRVIVEPSGIFDMDEFFDALHEEPLDRWYELGNVIAIADAGMPEDLSPEADYLLGSEAACAGKILLSRVQEVSEEKVRGTVEHLNSAMEKIRCSRRLDPDKDIISRDWSTLTAKDFEELMKAGWQSADYVKQDVDENGSFDSLFYMNIKMNEKKLRETAEKLLKDPACGKVMRVKGFMKQDNESWLELNATEHETILRPVKLGQEIMIVIGEGLNKEVIDGYWN